MPVDPNDPNPTNNPDKWNFDPSLPTNVEKSGPKPKQPAPAPHVPAKPTPGTGHVAPKPSPSTPFPDKPVTPRPVTEPSSYKPFKQS